MPAPSPARSPSVYSTRSASWAHHAACSRPTRSRPPRKACSAGRRSAGVDVVTDVVTGVVTDVGTSVGAEGLGAEGLGEEQLGTCPSTQTAASTSSPRSQEEPKNSSPSSLEGGATSVARQEAAHSSANSRSDAIPSGSLLHT